MKSANRHAKLAGLQDEFVAKSAAEAKVEAESILSAAKAEAEKLTADASAALADLTAKITLARDEYRAVSEDVKRLRESAAKIAGRT